MRDLRDHVGRRVIVVLDEYSIDGTLTRASAAWLELERSTALYEQGNPKPIDGTAVVPTARVVWVQVP